MALYSLIMVAAIALLRTPLDVAVKQLRSEVSLNAVYLQ